MVPLSLTWSTDDGSSEYLQQHVSEEDCSSILIGHNPLVPLQDSREAEGKDMGMNSAPSPQEKADKVRWPYDG